MVLLRVSCECFYRGNKFKRWDGIIGFLENKDEYLKGDIRVLKRKKWVNIW